MHDLAVKNLGSEYTDEEVELLLAMECFKKKHGIRFPTFTDVLKVARSLGYRKCTGTDSPGIVHVHRNQQQTSDQRSSVHLVDRSSRPIRPARLPHPPERTET